MVNKSKFLYLAAALLMATPVKAELLNLSGYTLDNGMRVIVVPNHKAPIVKHMVWYKVGAADEQTGKGGAAHLLEHLMFRGTSKVKGQEFNRILEENGADSNAFTSQDFTVYHQFIDISRLELAMFLEADRMQNLTIDEESFETERQIVFQERKQVVENNPLYRFNEEMQRAFWQNHPYSRPITGTEDEIMNLSPDDVKNIYNTYYTPENAILVLAGDIEPETAFRLAEKYYGNVKAKGMINSKAPVADDVKTTTTVQMELLKVDVPRLLHRYKAPSYTDGEDKIYAYMVLSKYLGKGEISSLYKKLVVEAKVANAVSASYNYTSLGGGSFSISALPAKGISMEELRQKLDEAVNVAIKEIDAKKVEQVKKQMLAGLVYVRDNPNDAAQIVGMLAAIGMNDAEIESYEDNIKKVTLAEVKAAAKELLSASHIEGTALPKGVRK